MTEPLFKKTEIAKDFSQLNKLIYSWPKAGKTTFASKLVSQDGRPPLFIATEDGHSAMEVYAQRTTSWDGFIRLKDFIVKNAETVKEQHSTIVIDLVTDLDQWCAEYVSKKYHVTHLSDMDYGKGFSLAKTEFQSVMGELLNVLPVTFIAHTQEKEIIWNGEKARVQAPSMSKGAIDWVNGKCDAIMFILPANSKRERAEISMLPSTTAIAGCRFPHMVRTFPFYANDPGKTYKEMQECFANNNVKESKDEVRMEG